MKLATGLLSALIVTGLCVSAAPLRYSTVLLGANENPPNASPGIGLAIVTFDTAAHTMRVQIIFDSLAGTTTAAHIHCCAAAPDNVGVATETPSFSGFPQGVTSGSFDSTFDMTLALSYRPGFLADAINLGNIAMAEATLANGLAAGTAYLNIHSTSWGGGEIRGFLQPVPEPATYALVGAALLALVVRRRR